MEITETSSATPATARSEAASAPTRAALSSDFETFLRMLTTQMQNQDPLNPIESSDFAVQLATFSGVEQQVRTNDLLKSLAEGLGASGMSQLAGWIGTEVRSAASVRFDGAPLTLHPSEVAGADRLVLLARDADGAIVSRSEVPPGGGPLTWAGARGDGTPLPPGLYSFVLEGYEGEELLGTGTVEHYAPVIEVRAEPDGPVLVLPGDATVPAREVSAVRPAAGETDVT